MVKTRLGMITTSIARGNDLYLEAHHNVDQNPHAGAGQSPHDDTDHGHHHHHDANTNTTPHVDDHTERDTTTHEEDVERVALTGQLDILNEQGTTGGNSDANDLCQNQTGMRSRDVTEAQKDVAVDHIVEVDHQGVTLGNAIHQKTRSARNEKDLRSAGGLDHDLAPGHDPALLLRTLPG